ncbi:MAG: YhcH/YjgK/YiaL family protein [Opitutaceae bacterium]|nr:YhcH/YjgK/YiaL family protein [Opitutaceae bacterium]
MAIFGSLSTVRAQCRGLAYFDPAFAYLDELAKSGSPARKRLDALAAGESGRVELADGMFAIEQVYRSKPRAEGFFESHRKYIDIQVVLAGEELMEVAEIGHLPVKTPFDADRDVIIYGDFTGASVLRFRAGEAGVYFPADGHMPGLMGAGGPHLVRKTVVKVPVPA